MRVLLGFVLAASSACGEDVETLPEGENACAPDAELPGAGPHLCPAQSPVAYCDHLVGIVHTTDLVLSNRGTETVEIQDVRIRGDARCSFRTPLIDEAEIAPNAGAAVVRIDYFPQTPGEDRVFLEIESNAANFPLLEIGVCGRAIPSSDKPSDECFQCGEPESDDLACAPEE
jgi:hypothetical protein